MTIFFPDVSSYTPNIDPSKYPVLIARATLSSTVTDPTYLTFKAKAAAAGTLFLAYHWLNHGNLLAQAKHAFSVVGPGVPLMIDAEDEPGNTGYAGPLTVDDIVTFAGIYRALGGTVSMCYLPFWYWSGAMGAPRQLDQLAAAGLYLVSSNYPNAGYTEAGPGWLAYYFNAPVPVQWQYTSTPVDMNAYRGTVAEYAALVGGTVSQPNIPGGYDDYLPDTAMAILVGKTPRFGYPDATGPTWDNDALDNHNLQAVEGRLTDAIKALALPTVSQDQVDSAVAKVMTDPAWLSKLAAAVASHIHVS